MIAGEGLVGILLAILAVAGLADKMDLSASLDTGTAGGTVFIILMICAVLWAAKKSQDDQKL